MTEMFMPKKRHASTDWGRILKRAACSLPVLWLAACASSPPPPSTQHLEPPPPVRGKAPDFISMPSLPKPPKPADKPELYSVVVHDMAVRDLLFALARDAKLNVSVHPAISGKVTMSVLDQTLTEVLNAISQQVDMRYELMDKRLAILPDTPYLKIYRIDYPNITRNAQSSVSISINVASAGAGTGAASTTGGTGSNASETTIKNTTNNLFWETLVANLRDLLRETDRVSTAQTGGARSTAAGTPAAGTAAPAAAAATATAPAAAAGSAPTAATGAAGTSATAAAAGAAGSATTTASIGGYRDVASVIANPENGVINVRATQRQHEKVREFLDGILESARRQVLIEATIVEVDLSDRFQQGIDWSVIYRASDPANARGIVMQPGGPSSGQLTGGLVSSVMTVGYNRSINDTSITSALRLLESFGTLRVLSSPKLSVLNNQTSLLKVVDNEVYFTVNVTPAVAATATTPATPASYSTTIYTVPVGFLMAVTPQISQHGEVILNLRPTISRITAYATDPNPDVTRSGVINRIPIVQSREMESILRVHSGNIAVLGGLIQDSRDRKVDGVPGISSLPVVGDLLSYRDNRARKSELVIFLRPTVLNDASLSGDFQAYRDILPGAREALMPAGRPGQTEETKVAE